MRKPNSDNSPSSTSAWTPCSTMSAGSGIRRFSNACGISCIRYGITAIADNPASRPQATAVLTSSAQGAGFDISGALISPGLLQVQPQLVGWTGLYHRHQFPALRTELVEFLLHPIAEFPAEQFQRQ